jgi:cation diffusion facilitator family transporter
MSDHGHDSAHDDPEGHHPPDHHHPRRESEHDHPPVSGVRGQITQLFRPHHHDAAASIDSALEQDARGVRALKLSLIGLGLTAALQLVVVVFSGSVALLADTLHNGADALTALPIWLAFSLGRRAATRRFQFGYGRAEDLAGLVVIVFIAGSAIVAAYEAIDRLVHPAEVRLLWAVGLAGVVGFVGNELVAQYRIRVGRDIGSAALVADGLHARADGFTSLGVLAGAVGVFLGFPAADPLAGLVIALMIVLVLRDAARDVLLRVMDAVDPAIVAETEEVLREVEGVEDIGRVRLRWIGHRLHAEAEVTVDQNLTVGDGHAIAERARHALLHEVPHLSSALIHADPCGHDGRDPHADVAHHDAVAAKPAQPETAAARGHVHEARRVEA